MVVPDADFRLILVLDPAQGNPLSRAMRNRGLEVALLPPDWVSSTLIGGLAKAPHPIEKNRVLKYSSFFH